MQVQVTTGHPGSQSDTVVDASSTVGGDFTEELTINGETLYFTTAGAQELLWMYEVNQETGISFRSFEAREDPDWTDQVFGGTPNQPFTRQGPDDAELALEWDTVWNGPVLKVFYSPEYADYTLCQSKCVAQVSCSGWSVRRGYQCVLLDEITGRASIPGDVSARVR